MPKSKKNLSRELLPKLADALANSEEFCLLVKEFTSNRSDRLDTIVVAASAAIDYPEWGPSTSTGNAVVQSFTARLLHADPSTLSPNARRLQSMLSDRVTVKKHRKHLHRQVANRIGFKERDFHLSLPADISAIELERLSTPYPLEDHIVLEQCYDPLPDPPKCTIRPATTSTSTVCWTKASYDTLSP